MKNIITTWILISIILFDISYVEGNQESGGRLIGKKIVMIIGHRMFHDIEFKEAKEIFEREEANVIIASSRLSEAQGMGMYELRVKPDILVKEIEVNEFDAVVFVGGPGAHEFSSDQQVHKMVKQAVDQGKILAAIHLAPEILANAGVLKGKKAVAYMSYNIKTKGAVVTDKMVERDGNIITGRSQSAATEFGEAIVSALSK